MLVAESLCWRLFSWCWWFSQCIQSVTNNLNRSPTSRTSHQHIWSPTSVTNIDATLKIDWRWRHSFFESGYFGSASLRDFNDFSSLLIGICFILPIPMGFILKGMCRFSDLNQAINRPIIDENSSVWYSSRLTDSQTLSSGSTIPSTPTTPSISLSPLAQNAIWAIKCRFNYWVFWFIQK